MSVAKAAKVIIFTAQASENHTAVKVKNVLKWLKSGHEVRVQINGKPDRHKLMESIYNRLETESKSGATSLQKVVKPDSIKFVLRPTADANNIQIDDSKTTVNVDGDIDKIVGDKDLLSGEFEEELEKSIRDEKNKNKRR